MNIMKKYKSRENRERRLKVRLAKHGRVCPLLRKFGATSDFLEKYDYGISELYVAIDITTEQNMKPCGECLRFKRKWERDWQWKD